MTGSDLGQSAATQRLTALGATVMQGHAPEHVVGANAVVVSTAVRGDNPEVLAARAKRIPIVPRAVMLAELMRLKQASPSPARTARPPPPAWSPPCWPRVGSIRPS